MKKYWNGDESLLKTFWLVWVTGSILVTLIFAALVYSFSLMFGLAPASITFASFLLVMLFNPYYIFCWVANWRAARKNTTSFVAAITVKVLIVIHMVYSSYAFIYIGSQYV